MKIGDGAKSALMKKLIFALSSAGANGGLIIEKNLVTNHMEANRKSITVKDHVGREVNPYSPYDPIHEPNSDLSRFDYFAKHNVGYPCPELANTKPGETVEAELVWQWQCQHGIRKGEWTNFIDDELHDKNSSVPTRQIYRLVPKKEKAAEPFANFNEGKAKLKSEPGFLSWLHELTTVGYARNIFISTDHEDAIVTIYALKGDDSIDKCLDMYLSFKRRWKALNEL